MKQRSFYNTIELYGKELLAAQAAALSQEQKITRFLLQRGTYFPKSPSEIRREVFYDDVPVTSVRRALTNLTTNGDLVKLPDMIRGPYGKPEHLWTVSAKWTRAQPRQVELL